MKYKLKEYSKFILAEKFILNEADGFEFNNTEKDVERIVNDYLKTAGLGDNKEGFISKYYESIKAKLTTTAGGDESIDDITKKQLEELSQDISSGNIESALDLKEKVKQYVDLINNTFKDLSGEIANKLDNIKAEAETAIQTKEEETTTKEKLSASVKQIASLINPILNGKTEAKDTESAKVLENLTSIKDNLIPVETVKKLNGAYDSQIFEKLYDITNALEALNTACDTYITSDDNDIASLAKAAETAKKLIEDNKSSFDATLSIDNEKYSSPANRLKTLMQDPEAFRQAILDIFNKVFNGNEKMVEKAMQLNANGAITQELIHLGTDTNSNAFLYFLVNNPKIFLSDLLNASKYSILHNAYIDNKINNNDLRGNGDFKKADLLFNLAFYNTEINDYLKKRSQIKNLYKDGSLTLISDELTEKYGNNMLEYFNYIVYQNGYNSSDSFGNKLNDIATIDRKINNTVGEEAAKSSVPSEKVVADDEQIKKWVETVKPENYKKLILYILTRFTANMSQQEIQKLADTYAKDAAALEVSWIKGLADTVGKADINSKNIEEILKKIVEAAGGETPKEA